MLRARIPVTVTMRATDAGGRQSPAGLRGEYRPHVRVPGDSTYLGVEFFSNKADLLHPGETASITLELIYDVDYSLLQPGAEFDVLEGPHIVGSGVVN